MYVYKCEIENLDLFQYIRVLLVVDTSDMLLLVQIHECISYVVYVFIYLVGLALHIGESKMFPLCRGVHLVGSLYYLSSEHDRYTHFVGISERKSSSAYLLALLHKWTTSSKAYFIHNTHMLSL